MASEASARRTTLPGDSIHQSAASGKSDTRFEENLGQYGRIGEGDGRDGTVLFAARLPDASVLLRPDGISTVFVRGGRTPGKQGDASTDIVALGSASDTAVETHRIDMTLLGCNRDARVTALDQATGHVNYFTARFPDGLTGVREYYRVLYEGIYDHIDLEVIASDGRIKYNFIVSPGGDPRDIRMQYDGSPDLFLDSDGSLVLRSPLGGIRDQAPLCWTAEDEQPVRAKFDLHRSIVGFALDGYDTTKTLIIDPWATYWGRDQREEADGIAVDPAGNSYTTGISDGFVGPGWGNQGFIVKFNTYGVKQWETIFDRFAYSVEYLNGALYIRHGIYDTQNISWISRLDPGTGAFQWTQATLPFLEDIAVDGSGNIYYLSRISGMVGSTLQKLDRFGAPVWDMVINDASTRCRELACDPDGNILVAGSTWADTGIASAGAAQVSYAGNHDAFLLKFSPDGQRLWGTYCGGQGHEETYAVTTDQAGNIVLVGTTGSTTLGTPGTHQPTMAGGHDGFIVKYHPDGTKLWGTYYGGEEDHDFITAVATNNSGHVFVTGSTWSSTGIATPGTHQTRRSFANDAFVAKLSPDGERIWGTYFGGYGNDYGTGIGVDAFGYVYICGHTASDSLATPCAHQTTRIGGSEVFVAKFSPEGRLFEPVHFQMQPRDAGVCIGDGLDLRAKVGQSYVAYQWQVDTGDGFSNIPAGGLYRLETTDSLVIGPVDSSLNGFRFRCVITILPCGPVVYSDTATLAVFPTPEATITADGPTRLCRIGSVGLHANTEVGSTYQWFCDGLPLPGATAPSILVDSTGVFQVAVTNAMFCTALSDVLEVYVNPGAGADIQALGPTTICPNGSTKLQVATRTGNSFQWQKDGTDIPGASFPELVVTEPGDYRAIVDDEDHCTDTSDVITIQLGTLPPAFVVADGPTKICRGDSVLLRANTGTGYTYLWQRDGVAITTAHGDTCFAMVSGSYRVMVTDTNECSSISAPVDIVVGPDVSLIIDGATTFCEGDTVSLRASSKAGYTYRWRRNGIPISGADSAKLTCSISGMYRVMITDADNCTDSSETVALTMLPAPSAVITANGPSIFCAGDSVVLVSDSCDGCTYHWQIDGTVLPDAHEPRLTARQAGLYRVIVTNAAGCATMSPEYPVTHFPTPRANAGPDIDLCLGERVRLGRPAVGGTPPWTYQWFPSEGLSSVTDSMPMATPSTTTKYFLLVTDSLGCSSMDSVLVRVFNIPMPTISYSGNSIFCEGDSLLLTAPQGFVSYLWEPGGSTEQHIVVKTGGRYSVRVTDTNGCSGISEPVDVLVHPAPDVSLEGPRIVCRNSQTGYSIPSQAHGDSEWSVEGGAIVSGAGTESIVVQWGDDGRGRVRVRATDTTTGCSAEQEIDVEILESLRPRIDPRSPAFCEGDSIELDAGSGYASYQWSTGAMTRRIFVRNVGAYTVRVDDGAGCSGMDTVIVGMHPRPMPEIVASGILPLCEGDSVVLRTREEWRAHTWMRDGIPAGVHAGSITATQSGEYTVLVEDSAGCTGISNAFTVIVHPAPETRISGAVTSCTGSVEAYAAPASPAVRHAWTAIGGSIVSGQGTPAITVQWDQAGYGQVRIMVIDTVTGCIGEDSLIVTLHAGIAADIMLIGDSILCEGDAAIIEATAGFSQYTWSRSGIMLQETGRTLVVRDAGVYRVSVTDDNGCSAISRPIAITVLPVPKPIITGDGNLLTASPAASWQWYIDDTIIAGATTRSIVVSRPGQYRVRVVDENGCPGVSDPYFYQSMNASCTLGLPELYAAPGDTVTIPVMMTSEQNMEDAGAGAFSAVLTWNRTLLRPIGLAFTDSASLRKVRITGAFSSVGGAVAELKAEVLWGDAESTPIHLEEAGWNVEGITQTVAAGRLTVALCQEGGIRLFLAAGMTRILSVHPNPFNSSTLIAYELGEDGPMELSILDALGRRIAVLAQEWRSAGIYSMNFHSSTVASGVYMVVLRTSTETVLRRLVVQK